MKCLGTLAHFSITQKETRFISLRNIEINGGFYATFQYAAKFSCAACRRSAISGCRCDP
ncbi:hypothetical protein METHPM2_1580006 [Pseudomonas sp. PM2]